MHAAQLYCAAVCVWVVSSDVLRYSFKPRTPWVRASHFCRFIIDPNTESTGRVRVRRTPATPRTPGAFVSLRLSPLEPAGGAVRPSARPSPRLRRGQLYESGRECRALCGAYLIVLLLC
jgi:hypothetical protein